MNISCCFKVISVQNFQASSIRTEPNVTKTGWYEDSLLFMLDVSESGLFSGVFVPPPPRPKFLDGTVKPDAFTKCDLCSWAWKKSKVLSTESSFGNVFNFSIQIPFFLFQYLNTFLSNDPHRAFEKYSINTYILNIKSLCWHNYFLYSRDFGYCVSHCVFRD